MIKSYENTLKQIIIDVLGASDDTNYNISNDLKDKWFEKRKFEKDKNDDFLFDRRIIFFADFYDLKTIILKNWNDFETFFKNKNRFTAFFDEVHQYKNYLNQGKYLTKSQEELLSGITSDLKNTYTIYSNKKNNRNDYFVTITKVSDNVGSTWSKFEEENKIKPILSVDDDYELLIDANDPKDREIEYEVYHFAGKLRIKQNSNRFNFKIDKNLIGSNTMLVVKASTPETEYKNESIKKIYLTVIPN